MPQTARRDPTTARVDAAGDKRNQTFHATILLSTVRIPIALNAELVVGCVLGKESIRLGSIL
jgi:hypothetical protein